MQNKEFINKAVKFLIEIDSISEQLKDLKSEAKESGLDVATLTSVAKAIVSAKVDDLKEKSESVLEAINEYRS